ncbi:MAG: hypothetical protein ACXACX_10240 [Candidatus Hodarchaeales archaeon]
MLDSIPLLVIESLEINSFALIIEFILSIIITKFFTHAKLWEDSIKKTLVLNLTWYSIIAILNFLLYFGSLLSYVLSYFINLSLGLLLIKKFYQKEFRDSILNVSFILILGFGIHIIMYSGVFLISQNIYDQYSTNLHIADYQITIKIIEIIKLKTLIALIFWTLSILILLVSCIIGAKLILKKIRGKVKINFKN